MPLLLRLLHQITLRIVQLGRITRFVGITSDLNPTPWIFYSADHPDVEDIRIVEMFLLTSPRSAASRMLPEKHGSLVDILDEPRATEGLRTTRYFVAFMILYGFFSPQ
jgi:hypothetical protein